jgi:hypothetical protein
MIDSAMADDVTIAPPLSSSPDPWAQEARDVANVLPRVLRRPASVEDQIAIEINHSGAQLAAQQVKAGP